MKRWPALQSRKESGRSAAPRPWMTGIQPSLRSPDASRKSREAGPVSISATPAARA